MQDIDLIKIEPKNCNFKKTMYMPVKDLSLVHQLVSDLFQWPASRTEWEKFKLSDEQISFFNNIFCDTKIDTFCSSLSGGNTKGILFKSPETVFTVGFKQFAIYSTNFVFSKPCS